MSTAEERWEAACFSLGLAGLYHLRPQTLLIAECEAAEKPRFLPSQAAILSSAPLMLCWSRLEELFLSRKFNIVRAFEQCEGQGRKELFRGIEEDSIVGFSLDTSRLYLLFSSPANARTWKEAVTRLLNAYFRPSGSVSPRSSLSLRPCLGLLFDITPSDTPPGLKLTFLQPSGAYEEFCTFDTGQHPAAGREAVLAVLKRRVDAGNWKVLQLFTEEETVLDGVGKQGREGRDWLQALKDEGPRLNPQSVKFKEQSVVALQNAVSQQKAALSKSASPAVHLFALLSLYCTSLELAIAFLSPAKSASFRSQSVSPSRIRHLPTATNFSRPHKPSKPLRRPGNGYRDACDCHIY